MTSPLSAIHEWNVYGTRMKISKVDYSDARQNIGESKMNWTASTKEHG
jgi:hypothetical protein